MNKVFIKATGGGGHGVMASGGGALTLDSSSKWSVTADSTLAGLGEIEGVTDLSIPNIEGNGHQVTYDPSLPANARLKGKTYALAGGGQLVPQK